MYLVYWLTCSLPPPPQNARHLKRVRRRHTVGGTKDFPAVLQLAGSSSCKIDDEEKENEKALRRMSLPLEVADAAKWPNRVLESQV